MEDQDYEYYEKVLNNYEKELQEINAMKSSLETDVITEKDEINEINQHFKEEERTERMLGKKYLADIDEKEAGSILEEVNKKN